MGKLSLYVHIPFCVRKCAYCDFLSAYADEETKEEYVRCLCEEIRRESKDYSNEFVDTIFIGGGTPSVLSSKQLMIINKTIREHYNLEKSVEYSMEVNPGTLSSDKLQSIYQCGVNRLSFGLQSTLEKDLQCLGRIHTYEEFEHNYEAARMCGFQNINVDLMSGLPGQHCDDYLISLKRIAGLEPEHISAYGLIIEEGTEFYDRYHGKIAENMLPTEEEERDMYYLCRNILESSGYHQYEISNYAKDGRECQHNIGYWTGKNYLGLGIGASSMVNHIRWKNGSDLSGYLKHESKKEEYTELNQNDQMEEFMFLGLRLTKGISKKRFMDEFGISVMDVYGEWIEKMVSEKLILVDEGIRLTYLGMDLANYVMAGFLF